MPSFIPTVGQYKKKSAKISDYGIDDGNEMGFQEGKFKTRFRTKNKDETKPSE